MPWRGPELPGELTQRRDIPVLSSMMRRAEALVADGRIISREVEMPTPTHAQQLLGRVDAERDLKASTAGRVRSCALQRERLPRTVVCAVVADRSSYPRRRSAGAGSDCHSRCSDCGRLGAPRQAGADFGFRGGAVRLPALGSGDLGACLRRHDATADSSRDLGPVFFGEMAFGHGYIVTEGVV